MLKTQNKQRHGEVNILKEQSILGAWGKQFSWNVCCQLTSAKQN